ncbi:hypothetical protein FHR24_002757 [Wenyingzhuangia heitensis]|uniref:Uncharacterized protein n=1 Tax=Wenyingzhuangia heitensis TaxID=1487859 RepID=A0ABX0UBT0_9FLAO|nr:hypothetical protein [Wenyingzhuangia heitensis]NIJ46273.1 hypothetical protein [Wenyingzhuangia heitensis]
MNEFIELLKYTIPSIVTAGVAAYFFKQILNNETNKRKFEAFAEKKKHSLPIRLQAYERMTLFLERIEPTNILARIEPFEMNKIEYAKLLITQINAEFEHNLVQQIYISEDAWKLVKNAKQTTLNTITAQSMKENINSGKELQTALLHLKNESPIIIAQQFIQKEVQNIL